MKRRQFLAALGVGVGGFAGCLGTSDGSGDGTTDGGRTTGTGTKTETTTATGTPAETTAGAAGAPDPENVTLTASPGSAELPETTVEFTLRNDANTKFATNFYGWHLYKRAAGEWVHVSPRAVPEPLHFLRPGASHAWTLTVDNTASTVYDKWTNTYGMEEIAYSGLGPGAYRFRIAGWFEHGGESSSERRYGAAFELTGDPVELRPESSVTTTRGDGTLVVRTADYASARRGLRVTLTPAPDHEGEVERVITELAYRYRGLRNTLPYVDREGVERVRLFAPDAAFAVPGRGVSSYVEYEGTVYRVDAEAIETETKGEKRPATETETTDA